MNILVIPISPLEQAKSRLRSVFSQEKIKLLIISMVKDLGEKLAHLDTFDSVIVYCGDHSIAELAESYNLIGLKEKNLNHKKSFDRVIEEVNQIAIDQFNAKQTIFTFLDTVLISEQNLRDLSQLIKEYQLVICPSVHSAGISVLGRNPPDIVPTCFSDTSIPSFLGQLRMAQKADIQKIKIYDSFRAGFDIDIKRDLALAYEYLKALNLTDSHTFQFLEQNLTFSLKKNHNNRELDIITNRK
ncbi:MAG: hypothetical protein EU541_00905 [Promethearchaeota archaeon]|nr:MAG: hypothetical protein EU541_00905 [Candidatus Lokiarchaeota archaeon]